MKYKVKCSCGHEIIIDVFGKREDHAAEIWFRENNLCPDCFTLALGKQSYTKNLPKLNGSFKQIRWAMQLREKHIDALKCAYAASHEKDDYFMLLQFVSKLTEAKDFIDAEFADTSLAYHYSLLYKDMYDKLVNSMN